MHTLSSSSSIVVVVLVVIVVVVVVLCLYRSRHKRVGVHKTSSGDVRS